MVDYYRYLWSTTWPNMIVLLLIWVIVLTRLGWKILMMWRKERDAWGFLMLMGKVFIWIGVLAAYTDLLFFSQPDWLARPGITQGSVQAKAFDSGSRSYVLDIRSGSERGQFYVDHNVYDQVKVDDQVKLIYLPERREVVRCEVLKRLL